MNACHHIKWGAVDPVEVEITVEGDQRISGGEVTSTTYTETIWQCPLCHQECDAPKSEQKEWIDE
jgi:hypothetical protein